MNYLIVDDDSAFSSVLARVLKHRGQDVYCANNRQQALDICTLTHIDRVVLDLKLEFESGLSILSDLKARSSNIEILILTGYSSISTAVEAIKLGAVNYLCKPASAAVHCRESYKKGPLKNNYLTERFRHYQCVFTPQTTAIVILALGNLYKS